MLAARQNTDKRFSRAAELHRKGDLEGARNLCVLSLKQDPRNWRSAYLLGLIHLQKGSVFEAKRWLGLASRECPSVGEIWYHLGESEQALGSTELAIQCWQRAASCSVPSGSAREKLAGLAVAERRWADAQTWYRAAIELTPDSAQLHFHFGVAQNMAGDLIGATESYGRALALDPEHAEAYNNVALIYLGEGFDQEAKVCLDRAISANPELADAHNNLGNWFHRQGLFDDALQAYGEALKLRPNFAAALNGSGMSLTERGNLEAAEHAFRASLQHDPALSEAAANLGAVLQRRGDLAAARQWLLKSQEICRSDVLRIRAATMFSPIIRSRAEMLAERDRMAAELHALKEEALLVSERDLLKYPDTAFYLAYHGMNDRDLLSALAELHLKSCPSLAYTAPNLKQVVGASGRLRVGFVSRFFHNHSVGNFFNPIIEHLARQPEFDVRIFAVGMYEDRTTEKFTQTCSEVVLLSPNALNAARLVIQHRELDVLVYADLGMDPFTYYLSFSRLAPVQCVLHGHSDTSGVPAVDYYISSRLIEPAAAQQLYSERLLLLDTLPMYLREAHGVYPKLSRAALGLPEEGSVYLCPMKLHKIHPDMDNLVREILARDPYGWVVFFADDKNRHWSQVLCERMKNTLGETDRVVFLPFEPDLNRFRSIIASADVVLDTPHHGGGTTMNIAITVGTPIISYVGATARGRGPYSFYSMMGITEGVSDCLDHYATNAIGIASNTELRKTISRQLIERQHLYHRNDEVLEAYRLLFLGIASGQMNSSCERQELQ